MPGPSSSAHQVLVYSGPGVSPLSLSHTILTLSLLLLPHYTVQPVTPDVLAKEPWESACALLVIPGGRDLPYVEELTKKTNVTKRIKEFVDLGGRYLGICAGAYFATEQLKFDVGGDMEVQGERDLAFVPGSCTGPTYPGFAYAAESGSRAISLILEQGSSKGDTVLDHLYYNGGGHFVLPDPIPANIQVLARYGEAPSTSTSQGGRTDLPVAAVLSRKGKGKALLCSIHFEYPLADPPAKDAIARLDHVPDQDELERSERARIAWAEDLLELLDLHPPSRRPRPDSRSNTPGTSLIAVDGEEDPGLLLHPTHPSPIFVLSHPALPHLAEDTFTQPKLASKLTSRPTTTVQPQAGGAVPSDQVMVLRDGNDDLSICDVTTAAGSSDPSSMTGYLAKQRRSPPLPPSSDPAIEKLSLSETSGTVSAPSPPDFNAIPKTLLLPSSQCAYSASWTPLFNFDTYWSEIDAARKRYGRKTGVLRKEGAAERPAVGDALWYAETVTSTQTMLDRNPLLLTHLATPLTFLASFQLTGRGRGSNIWLSPPGCLQFSILLTLPSTLSSKIVFIQYLMALAVCEAIDDDGRLGVRVKWPNDIYAEAEGVGGSEVGSGTMGKAKLGGILVNTNYVGGQWRIVIGTGINVLNALPTTSLSQLHSLLAARSPQNATNPPTMESTFAKIMNSFEIKWEQFIEDKGFTGFMDEYLGRWLHTDQEVTLTTTEPHTRLRIKGITPDHGLLRCIPLDQNRNLASTSGLTPLYSRGDFGDDQHERSWGAGSGAGGAKSKTVEYVDLQPDGNSFDLMSGMIKRKV